MPWDIETYSGLEIYDPTDGARIGMRQLMIAINQREAAIGETETLWKLPDGTEKAQPDLTELIGAEVKVGSTIKTNCERIRSAIIALATPRTGSTSPNVSGHGFVEASESDTYWTITTLQTSIGQIYTASIGPQDDQFLQNSKDILDRLIYFRVETFHDNKSATRYYNTEPAAETSWDDAWGAMTSESLSDPGAFSGWSARYADPAIGPTASGMHLGAWGGSGSGKYSTCRIDTGTSDFDLSDYSGTLTKSQLNILLLGASPNWNSGTFEVDFGGVTISGTGAVDVTSIMALGDVNTTSFAWDSVPGSITPTGEFSVNFRMGSLVTYIDMAGIFSDQ